MWWYAYYDQEILDSIKIPQPNIWGPERPAASAFAPSWKPSHAEIIAYTFILAMLFTFLRYLLVKYLLQPFANKNVIQAGYSKDHVVRFCESGVRLAFYLPSSIAIIAIALQTEYLYMPWKMFYIGELPSMDITWLYYCQIGWYLHQIFCHLVLDVRKKDFLIMLVHHIATVLLLWGSWIYGYYRIGLIILLAHDPCDPFLELGKMFNYLNLIVPGIISFIGLVVSWIFFRIFFFSTLLYTGWFEAREIMGYDAPGFFFFLYLLILLQCMHIYWFVLILRVGCSVWSSKMDTASDFDSREIKNNKK